MTDGTWTASPLAAADAEALEARWRAAETHCPGSFFQSWAWIGTWLATAPVAARTLVAGERDGVPVALGLFTHAAERRLRVLPVRRLMLAETGDPRCDMITIEYNGPLLDAPERFDDVLACLLHRVPGWDELVVAGAAPEVAAACAAAAERHGLQVQEFDRKPLYWVDLAAVAASGKSHLDTLSSNTRYQIRRAYRAYEARGALTLRAAESQAEAFEYFDALGRHHQQYWTSRGQPGVFGSPFFQRFHRALIERNFAAGAVELLRIAAGDREIGYLYNFVHRGRVYAYQSGFVYEEDPKVKPGLVSHALAIEHAQRCGRSAYDLLAGHGQYKASLASATLELAWLRLQRPRAALWVERQLRAGMRRARALRARRAGTA